MKIAVNPKLKSGIKITVNPKLKSDRKIAVKLNLKSDINSCEPKAKSAFSPPDRNSWLVGVFPAAA